MLLKMSLLFGRRGLGEKKVSLPIQGFLEFLIKFLFIERKKFDSSRIKGCLTIYMFLLLQEGRRGVN